MTYILVINAGSSSLKYQLIDIDREEIIAKGICERIGIAKSTLCYKPANGESFEKESPMKTHEDAIKLVLETAEQVKRRYVFLQEPLSTTEIVRTPSGAKRVDHAAIELIIEARAGELVSLIRAALKEMGVSPEASPVTYLTGGGLAMMKSGIDYLKRGLQLSIQRDTPWVADMDTPNYTSAFAALDFVLRATSDDVVTNTTPASVVDRLRNLFSK